MTQIEKIFRQHYVYLLNVAYSLLHDQEESRDVVSDTFAAVLERGHHINDDMARQYLAVSVRNRCLKRIARLRLKERVARLYPIEQSVLPDDVAHETRLRLIEDAIENCLDGDTREAFKLCYIDKLTHKQAAGRLGLSVAAVDKRIASALRILRETFKVSSNL